MTTSTATITVTPAGRWRNGTHCSACGTLTFPTYTVTRPNGLYETFDVQAQASRWAYAADSRLCILCTRCLRELADAAEAALSQRLADAETEEEDA